MRKSSLIASACALALCSIAEPGRALAPSAAMIGFTPAHAASERALEARLDGLIEPKEMSNWLQRMSSAPNHVSSPHDRENAEWELAQFKSWGWDAKIEAFDVLDPLPVSESLELLGPKPFKAKLHEPPVAGDRTSDAAGQLPPYVAYQSDGDVTAPLVYVNYGLPDDYKALERLGISVKGKIVIVRYGASFRGIKPKLAQEHGALGCLIYSDPGDDGYASNDVYPKGPERNSDGVQRGSVEDITLFPGDPLTPGLPSVKGVKRQYTRESSPAIMKIPTLPISYGDAQPLLEALDGPLAPKNARGALAITYHVGPSTAVVHLLVKSDWAQRTIYDVIAVMKGSETPDQWVVRGNHHDGWVFGAEDPLAGQVALMAEAKAIGELAKAGIRPKRTLVYASWDGEEEALLGSTEWVEAHADELQKKAVAYINSDATDRGYLSASGSQALTRLANEVASEVIDPETGATLRERQQAKAQVAAISSSSERDKRLAKIAASGADLPLESLGSGSDYTAFLHHLGVASFNIQFGGEIERDGVYHSAYDSYDHYARFGDPGEIYGAALAKTTGRLVLRLANADLVPMRFSDTADTFAEIVADLKHVATTERERSGLIETLREKGAFRLASDPHRPLQAPQTEATVQSLDFTPLDGALAKLKTSAAAFDALEATKGVDLPPAARAVINQDLSGMEQKLLSDGGLPGRPWYRNLAYAPGVLTGYGSKTFPGIREAIEAGRTQEAQRFIGETALAIRRYSEALDHAASFIH